MEEEREREREREREVGGKERTDHREQKKEKCVYGLVVREIRSLHMFKP